MLSSRRVVPLLALLSLTLHFVIAQDTLQSTLNADLPTAKDKAHYQAAKGNDLVHQTWNILRDLEPKWRDSPTVAGRPPSGFTGTAWFYVKLVFKTLFMNSPSRSSETVSRPSPELRNCVETLQIGASYHDSDAIFLLAEMHFYGNFSCPRDFETSFKYYELLADLDGNATAQHMLGLMYATGIGAPRRDQARALLYHTFAAEQGDTKSEMTLAFRYHLGIGTGRDCSLAAEYYKRVADKAMDWWQSGPPGGHSIERNAVRWVEFEGGAYGEGASYSSSGPNAPKEGSMATNFDDMIEYMEGRERPGDWYLILSLGKNFYDPPRGYKKNFKRAQKQFNKLTRVYWGKDGKINPRAPKGIEKYAGKAATFTGRMLLRGEGVERNLEKAITWFRRGVTTGEAFAQYHMGILYRDGLGVPKDGSKAASYLKAAAEQGLPIAQAAFGVLFLDQGDTETAGRYFEHAATAGNMEGFYYLAELTSKGVGRERSCGLSVAYYKMVAEKAELLHSSFIEANSAFERGDLERAFVASLGAAEQGYENAQANVAFILDHKKSMIDLSSVPLLANPLSATSYAAKKRSKFLNNPSLSLAYYTRSAQQANIDSLVKMGDYYLTGVDRNSTVSVSPQVKAVGSNPENIVYRDLDKASTCYTTAAESHHSAQAFWNLGWMHENGIGPVEQDFHMAKRYYDLALEMNKEAYFPVKLALLKLRARSWWNGVSGGTVKPMGSDEDKENRPKSFWEWLNRFLDAAEEMEAQEYAQLARQARAGGDEEGLDGLPYGGGGGGDSGETGGAMPGGDNDFYYDPGPGDEYLADIDDGLIESLMIIALAGALAMLVYARQQRQRETRERREQQQPPPPQDGRPAPAPAPAPGQQATPPHPENVGQQGGGGDDGAGEGAGFFPRPDDPGYANWLAGGIGN